jgi:hypothetical protein
MPMIRKPGPRPRHIPPPDEPGLHADEDNPNEAFVASRTVRDPATIPTIDSVLEEFGVDLEVWTTDNPVVNRWEMGYTDSDKKPGHYTLYQVKIPLQRRVPVGVDWPVFRGADVEPLPTYRVHITRGLKRAAIMPDIQAGFRRNLDTGRLEPFHDPVACGLFATVVKWMQPDQLVGVGDNLDFAESGKYLVLPEYYFTTQASLDWLASYLWMLRPWVGTGEDPDEFVYLEGNHEKRLPVTLVTNSLFACRLRKADRERLLGRGLQASPHEPPVLSVPGLLGLEEMRIRWVGDYPRGRWWLNDNIRVTHSEKLANKSGHSVGKSLEGASCSMMFGHSHRLELAHQTVHRRDKPRVYGAYNVGTLARVDGTVPSNSAEENWQQGFAVVDYQPNDRQLHQVQLVNIFGGACIFEGTLFEADPAHVLEMTPHEEIVS